MDLLFRGVGNYFANLIGFANVDHYRPLDFCTDNPCTAINANRIINYIHM